MKFSLPTIAFTMLASLAGASEPKRMVLKYDHDIDMEDVAFAVDAAEAQVVRQLACTRGLLISVDDEGRNLLEYMEGLTVVPENDAHPVRHLGVNDPQGSGRCDYKETCDNLDPVSSLSQDDVNIIKTLIATELNSGGSSFDGSLGDNAGAIMRLAFHDAASFDKNDSANLSGLNGCVNKNNAGNAGLENVQAYLRELQEELLPGIHISIADLTVLAAIVALEETTKVAKDANSNYDGELDIEFKYGRPDIDCSCEEDFLPPALTSDGSDYSFQVLDETMRDTMGFTRKEIVALMGTHTLGAMSEQFSGFTVSLQGNSAPWVGAFPPFGVFSGNDGFDNGYYKFIFAYPWDKKETIVGGATIIEWNAIPFNFLNSDASLAFEIDFVDENGDVCNRFGGSRGCNDRSGNHVPGCVMCPELNNAYGQAARSYAEDQAAWLRDYSKVFQKMVDDLVPCRKVKLMTPL